MADTVTNDDARHAGAGADFGACFGRSLGHCPRQRTDAAFDCDAAAARCRIDRRVQQQARARAGRPWALSHAKDAARGDRGLQQIVREPLGDEIRGCHRHPSQQTERVGPAEGAKAAARLQQIPPFGCRGSVERGRRRFKQLAEEAAKTAQDLAEFAVVRSVCLRQRGNCGSRPRFVDRKSQRAPVGRQHDEPSGQAR